MVISHKYRYLFIEIPLTASWAIRNELCQLYGGEPILHKHAAYVEFQRTAPEDQLDYFVFATVRHPLDCIVSRYFKLKTDHKGTFTKTESLNQLVIDYSDMKRYRGMQDENLDFPAYFKKYHQKPYSDMVDLSSDRLDYLIRFENLQAGFSEVLKALQIKQERPVPVTNITKGKDKAYIDYYQLEVQDQAKRVCGPYMKKWGYDFPADWGTNQPKQLDWLRYRLHNRLRYFYLTNLRYNNSPYSRVIRRLRAVIFK